MLRDLPRFLSVDGRLLHGVRRLVSVQSPAAAADWSVQVPGGRQWRILLGQFRLTTDGTVANRQVDLQIQVEGTRVWASAINSAQTATQTIDHPLVAAGSPGQVISGAVRPVHFIPLVWLAQFDTFGTTTNTFGPADQYDRINLFIEEAWFTNQDLHDEELLHERATTHLVTGS